MPTITLTNQFHNSEVSLRVNEIISMGDGMFSAALSPAQQRRAKRELCGFADCQCSDDFGCNGSQHLADGGTLLLSKII